MLAITAILNETIFDEVVTFTYYVYAWAESWFINIPIESPLLTIFKWLINRNKMKLITTRAFMLIPAIKVLDLHLTTNKKRKTPKHPECEGVLCAVIRPAS